MTEASELYRLADRQTHATFAIHGDFSDPDSISRRLNACPTQAWGKGETYVGHVNREETGVMRRPVGMWAVLSIPAVQSQDMQAHVEYLCNLLEPHIDAVRELMTSPGIKVQSWLHQVLTEEEASNGWFGYELAPHTVVRLAALCQNINVTLKFPVEGGVERRDGG